MSSGVEIARQEGLHQSSVNELLRLTLLSPQIVRALLAGRQPRTLTLRWLKNHELPADWEAQREVFGGFDTWGAASHRALFLIRRASLWALAAVSLASSGACAGAQVEP